MTFKFNIFNCWQSDDKKARYCIKEALEDAKVELKVNGFDVDIVEGAEGELGMAKIDDAVLKNIRQSDVFICDLTPVAEHIDTTTGKRKSMPNSNVLVELGYALSCKGTGRMIGLARKGNISVENMPFDIRQMRLTYFSNKQQLKNLADFIEPMLKSVINEVSSSKSEYDAVVRCADGSLIVEGKPTFCELVYDPNGADSINPNKRKIGTTKEGFGIYFESNMPSFESYTNHSLVPVHLAIVNLGVKMLENCKLIITADNNKVTFEDSNKEGRLLGIKSIHDKTSTYTRYVQHGGHSNNQININPNDSDCLEGFYLKSPHDVTDFKLHWKLTSGVAQSIEGDIDVHLTPKYKQFGINYVLNPNEDYITEYKTKD